MRIVSVTATAFGALQGQTLNLGERLNVVVGPNESGKSTWHAAMYAALCGYPLPSHLSDNDRRFARYRKPRPGPEWIVDAEIEVEPGRRLILRQNLVDPAASTVHDADGRDVTDELRRDGTIDLMPLLGLDRRSYAATAWVEQARTRTALISVDGRNDLQLAVAACIDEDRAVAGIARLDELLHEYVGDPEHGPLARAVVVAEQRRGDREQAHRLQERRSVAEDAAAEARTVADREQRRLRAAEAVEARRHATELRGRVNRRTGGDFPGVTNTRSGWPTYEPPAMLSPWPGSTATLAPPATPAAPVVPVGPPLGETSVHHTVADAERELRAIEWAQRNARSAEEIAAFAKPDQDAEPEPEPSSETETEPPRARRSWLRPGRGAMLALAGGGLALAALGLFLASQGRAIFGAVLAVIGAAVAVLGVLSIVLMAFYDPPPTAARARLAGDQRTNELPARERSIEELQWQHDEALEWLARVLRERGYADAEPASAELVLEQYRSDCAVAGRAPKPRVEPAAPRPSPEEEAAAELRALEERATAAEAEAERLEALADPFDLRLPFHEVPDNIRPSYERALRSVEDLEQTVASIDEDVAAIVSPTEAQTAVERAEQTVARLRRLEAVLTRARDELVRAREAKLRDIAVGIAPRLNDYLAEVTNRPHSSEDVHELQHQIGESLVLRDPELGSYNTSELTYLFTRVELGRHLTNGHALGPLLLDDVNSSADRGRIRRIMNVLRGIARQRQVVVFAHEDEVAEWARQAMSDDEYLRLHLLTAVDQQPRTHHVSTPQSVGIRSVNAPPSAGDVPAHGAPAAAVDL